MATTNNNVLDTSEVLKDKLKKLGKAERRKVFDFFQAFEQGGFPAINSYSIQGYIVRNKSSDNVDPNDPDFAAKVKFAQENLLWHFHIGFYDYNYTINGYTLSQNGDLTSQWVIHYQKFADNHINVVDLTPHPPFELPSKDSLK